MAGQRDHQDVGLAVAERAHALEAKPVLTALAVERPLRAVLPLRGDVAALRRRHRALNRHVVFAAMDVHLRIREIRDAAGMIAIEMRQ